MKKHIFISIFLLSLFLLFGQENTTNLLHLTDDTFDSVAQDSLIIVDFYADWCGPCKKFAPIFAEAATKFPDVTFIKLNVDECKVLAQKYDIQFIPYIVAMKNGEIIERYKYKYEIELFEKWIKKVTK